MSFSIVAQEDVEKMMKKLQEATQEYINQSEEAVQDFIDKNDKEFAKFLEQDWQMFQAYQGKIRDNKPKPEVIPVADQKPDIKYQGVKVELTVTPVKETEEKIITKPIIQSDFRQNVQKEKINLSFYSTRLDFEFDVQMKGAMISNISNESISHFWKVLSLSDYQPLLDKVLIYRNDIKFNDWGFIILIYDLGKRIYNENGNWSSLFTWFIMSKAGYDIKVGYDNTDILLLVPTNYMIYSTPYLILDNRRYFIFSRDKNNNINHSGNIYTYQGQYTGADKELNMNILKSPILSNQKLKREYKFKFKDTFYTVPVIFYKDIVDYFEYYPQTNFEVYFSSEMTPSVNYSFLIAFKPLIENRTEPEAVNMILRFVQTSFKYKTDGEQFSREKPLFPEETLYYQYSDCEDRSILFAHLINELLGLKVIGLSYPGHIATAVEFSTTISGDYIIFNNEKYLICDPTYINADIGQSMPQYRGKNPEIIKF